MIPPLIVPAPSKIPAASRDLPSKVTLAILSYLRDTLPAGILDRYDIRRQSDSDDIAPPQIVLTATDEGQVVPGLLPSRIALSATIASKAADGPTDHEAAAATIAAALRDHSAIMSATNSSAPVATGNMVVAGAGSPEANGVYTVSGAENGKPFYNKVGAADNQHYDSIFWTGFSWIIKKGYVALYVAYQNVATPNLVTSWNVSSGTSPAPTVTAETAPVARPVTGLHIDDVTPTGIRTDRLEGIIRTVIEVEIFAQPIDG